MKWILLVLAAVACALPGPAYAWVSPTSRTFEGVWKISKYVRTGSGALTDTQPQPSLLIFSRGYYAIVRDNGHTTRHASPEPKDPLRPSDEEKIAKYSEWAPVAASAGTFEVKGHTLITHNIIAKQVRGINLTEEADFKFSGPNVFVVTVKSAAGAPLSDTEITYTRVR